jgi:hypothetical protein
MVPNCRPTSLTKKLVLNLGQRYWKASPSVRALNGVTLGYTVGRNEGAVVKPPKMETLRNCNQGNYRLWRSSLSRGTLQRNVAIPTFCSPIIFIWTSLSNKTQSWSFSHGLDALVGFCLSARAPCLLILKMSSSPTKRVVPRGAR